MENKLTHGHDDHSKRTTTAKRRGAKPSCTHCEKEGHDELNCWTLHPKPRPERNDRKGKQKVITTMLQNPDSKSEEDEKVTVIGFAWGRPIDLGSTSGDKMKFVAFGIMARGPIKLGLDSSNESRISANIMKRPLPTAG